MQSFQFQIKISLDCFVLCDQLSNYPRCTLQEDFGLILKSQQFCDVTLLVGSEEMPVAAHQAMLAARSHFLKAKIK